MFVGELIELLKTYDPDRLVVLAKDAEGNNYSPLAGCDEMAYRADSTWSGEVGLEKLTEEDKKAGYTEEDIITDGVKALVLGPVN